MRTWCLKSISLINFSPSNVKSRIFLKPLMVDMYGKALGTRISHDSLRFPLSTLFALSPNQTKPLSGCLLCLKSSNSRCSSTHHDYSANAHAAESTGRSTRFLISLLTSIFIVEMKSLYWTQTRREYPAVKKENGMPDYIGERRFCCVQFWDYIVLCVFIFAEINRWYRSRSLISFD